MDVAVMELDDDIQRISSYTVNLDDNEYKQLNQILIKQEAPEPNDVQLEAFQHEFHTIKSEMVSTDDQFESLSMSTCETKVISNQLFELKSETLDQDCEAESVENISIKKELLHEDLDIKSEDETVQEPCLEDKNNLGNQISKHMKLHTGEKLFQCNICDYTCAYRWPRINTSMNSRASRMVLMALESNKKSPSPIENIKRVEKCSVSNMPIQFDDGFILENCKNNLEFAGIQVPEVMTAQSVDISETNPCSEDTNEVELASSLLMDNNSLNFVLIPDENVETFEIENNDDPGKEVEDDTDAVYVMEDCEESSFSTSEEEAEKNAPKEAEDDPVVNAEVEGSQNLKRKRTRMRFVNRSLWKRNNNKYKRMKGQAYIGYTRSKEKVWKNDTQREARTMGKRCKEKHAKIYECSKLTDDVRSIIFSKFWSEMTWEQKKIFVVNHVDISKPTRRRTKNQETQKSSTFKYFLKDTTTKMRVCKNMFLSTLSLSEWSVRSWCQNSTLPSVDVLNARRSCNREANGTKNVEQRKFLTQGEILINSTLKTVS